MASNQVRERSRTAAEEYFRGEPEEARRELGEMAFETLETVFPEASSRRAGRRAGTGFATGVLVGATLTLLVLRQLRHRR